MVSRCGPQGNSSPEDDVPRGKQSRWWVYILRCADGSLYTGVTTDVPRRLQQHTRGTASKYTRARRPVELAFRERAANHGAALRREAAIKRLVRKAKEELIARRRS
jgi:putative endonuclease